MKIRRNVASILAALWLVAFAVPSWAQFNSVLKSSGALEQLRTGVQSYQRGHYAESILLFEKALAYEPGSKLIEYWLGRAYLKSGYEETALRVWQGLVDDADAPPFLKAKVAALRASRAIAPSGGDYRYVEVERFEGQKGKAKLFARPSAIIPRPNGSLLVVAHGSNELVTLDASGVERDRFRGGLQGFDRPFGAVYLPDGTLFVTEYNGDRVSRIAPDGKEVIFGSKGRADGSLIGPEYTAADANGYIYIVDFGNQRVCKFDDTGAFILSFGTKVPDSGFPGFSSPTGIFASGGVVYVADNIARAIYKFDESGNYLGPLADGELHMPEGISSWEGDRALLVADTDRIVSIDLASEAVSLVYSSPNKKARIVGAAADYNGNVVACDFDSSTVLVLSDVSSLASGYDVEIESIDSSAFPKVSLDAIVRDKNGMPVVGLKEGNFYLSETIRRTTQIDEGGKAVIKTEEAIEPALESLYLGSGDKAVQARSILVLERSADMDDIRETQRSILSELYPELSATGWTPPSLVTAGPVPALQASGDLMSALRVALAPSSGKGRFDQAIRLAATELLPSGNRDAVVYIGTGAVDESSFAGTTLSELAALLRNNGIRFYAVLTGTPDSSLRFLADRTGGELFSADRPRGLGDLASSIAATPTGRYRFSFTSQAQTSFGRGYLSVGLEAYLYKRSGKDELGYYAPLK
jgi:hypothetical protein